MFIMSQPASPSYALPFRQAQGPEFAEGQRPWLPAPIAIVASRGRSALTPSLLHDAACRVLQSGVVPPQSRLRLATATSL